LIQIKGLPRMGAVRPSVSCFTCQSRNRSDWCTLTDDEMKVLSGHKVGNSYAPGQVIFYEGNACLGIHCIEGGSVALKKADGAGEPVVMGLRGPGDTLGYLAYFSGRGYSSTAVALTDSRICFIDRAVVRTLLQRNPSLGLGFLRKMADQVTEAERDRVRSMTLPLRARVAHLLLVLKDRSATVDDKGSIVIDLPLPRRDLAAMVGARPESLSRVLRDLEEDGVARFAPRQAVIPDLDALLDEVEGDSSPPQV
jgi:CRP/FNR family transcriptional regulator